jgi:hypothetical protein
MTSYSTYKDINNYFIQSTLRDTFPYKNHWQGDPLSNLSLVESRQSGFRPYYEYPIYSRIQPFGNENAIYQKPCDQILPVNKYYNKYHTMVFQP